MFSKLAVRNAALLRNLPAATRLNAEQLRHFSRARVLLQASTTVPNSAIPVEDEKQEESIVQSMGGWYPLLGLGAAALIGKEFIILNGSSMNLVFFYSFYGWLYLTQGEMLSKMFHDVAESVRKTYLYDPLDLSIEHYKQAIISFKAQSHILEYIKDVAKHSPLSIAAEAKALNTMAANKAREETLETLTAQKGLQYLKNLRVESILQQNFAEDVEIAWEEADSKLKDKFMQNALADLESGEYTHFTLEEDPLKQVYKIELQKYAKKLAPITNQPFLEEAERWPKKA
eukprot:g77083.t1